MRFLFRSLSGLFIAFLTLGLLFLAGFQLWQATVDADGPPAARGAGEQVYTARLLTVSPQTVQPVMQVFGTVQSRRRLELRAGAAGQIVHLDPAMQEGGQVSAGQLLVRIDPASAQAALDNRLAARDDAQASLGDGGATCRSPPTIWRPPNVRPNCAARHWTVSNPWPSAALAPAPTARRRNWRSRPPNRR
ncbi:hypothetical protein [Paracoccus stylophorae]|uniref:hypothetical protein n=1 Tax=Paracoccus stylophorae TaxID=659350 RepID=UPI00235062FA|nr:hypothetical protein [Paracoccus stylophorae]